MSERRKGDEATTVARGGAADEGGSGERDQPGSRSEAEIRPALSSDTAPETQRSPGGHGDDPAEMLVGKILADRYRIDRLLGTGGMGSVYLGEHVHMRNAVAIKVLHAEFLAVPEIVARFEREAIAGARINDPHVVNATDFGRLSDGSFYLVLEYVQGRSLASVLDGGSLDQIRALRIAHQIVQALVAAHAAGVIHRDLKPENVMLVKRPDEPDFVKVLDFGIAKVTMSDRPSLEPHAPVLTQAGTVFGTPQYMAPEQAGGTIVDHRVDLYTVGIMLYEMVVGFPPFQDEEVGNVLAMQIKTAAPPLPPHLNQSLVRLVMTQLAKEPDERSQSAEELLAWIEEVIGKFSQVAPLPGGALQGEEPGSYPDEPGSFAGAAVSPPLPPAGPAESVPDAERVSAAGFPLWGFGLIALAGLVLAGVAVGGVWFATRKGEVATSPPAQPGASSLPASDRSAARDAQVDELLARAATGEDIAIKAIEMRAPEQRSAAEWVALARGRMQLARHKSALQAYGKALDLDASLAKDITLLAQVRKAAGNDDTAEEALRLAALRLGTDGADLLYHVWVSTKAKTSTTQLAKQLVYSEDVRPKASPALAVALDLREAETCEQIKALLPRATLHGDTRAYRVLMPLMATRGCGVHKREDCYPCLREGPALAKAIEAVKERPEPAFLVVRQ